MEPENTFVEKGLAFYEQGFSTRSEGERPELLERNLYRNFLKKFIPDPQTERNYHFKAELSAVEAKLDQIQERLPNNAELHKYVNERVAVALCSWQLSNSHFRYLMVTWGCEPSVAKKWLNGVHWRLENCKKASMWLLMAAFPVRTIEPQDNDEFGGTLDEQMQNEKWYHDQWQNRRGKIERQQQHQSRVALLPPKYPRQIRTWRMMALWRAHKLGWAGARSSSDGLLKGSFKDAAAKITMLEFGLDADNGGHNAILHRQLLAIDPLHWQELMETKSRDAMITNGCLINRPGDISHLPSQVLSQILIEHVKRWKGDFDEGFTDIINLARESSGQCELQFTKPGEVEAILGSLYRDDASECFNNQAGGDLACLLPYCPKARSFRDRKWNFKLSIYQDRRRSMPVIDDE
ncbi:hypothetical protein E8E14_007428 [Neopestalotiopsis sp. 37M]|nr:hypothetical protein E8E14_007428 [Neopestalotiopsis sp. 37M]